MAEIESERMHMLGIEGTNKDENDEEEIEARLTKMLGGGEQEPLLQDGEGAH